MFENRQYIFVVTFFIREKIINEVVVKENET
jgi:hypothetical protein